MSLREVDQHLHAKEVTERKAVIASLHTRLSELVTLLDLAKDNLFRDYLRELDAERTRTATPICSDTPDILKIRYLQGRISGLTYAIRFMDDRQDEVTNMRAEVENMQKDLDNMHAVHNTRPTMTDGNGPLSGDSEVTP